MLRTCPSADRVRLLSLLSFLPVPCEGVLCRRPGMPGIGRFGPYWADNMVTAPKNSTASTMRRTDQAMNIGRRYRPPRLLPFAPAKLRSVRFQHRTYLIGLDNTSPTVS